MSAGKHSFWEPGQILPELTAMRMRTPGALGPHSHSPSADPSDRGVRMSPRKPTGHLQSSTKLDWPCGQSCWCDPELTRACQSVLELISPGVTRAHQSPRAHQGSSCQSLPGGSEPVKIPPCQILLLNACPDSRKATWLAPPTPPSES